MYNRQLFTITTDTGVAGDAVKGDTGPAMFGEIMQVRVLPREADTGGDLEIGLYPTQGDTGDGFLIYSNNDSLGSASTFAPRQKVTAGGDGTTDTGYAPYVAAGDYLRVKIRAGRVVAAGGTNQTRVMIWSKSDA